MEVVTIEKRTFSYVCERFTEFAKRIECLCSTHTQKVENWLDSQEVCLLLGFSKRTLQYYRSSGRLAYSQIGSKIYYKSSDIERIICFFAHKKLNICQLSFRFRLLSRFWSLSEHSLLPLVVFVLHLPNNSIGLALM